MADRLSGLYFCAGSGDITGTWKFLSEKYRTTFCIVSGSLVSIFHAGLAQFDFEHWYICTIWIFASNWYFKNAKILEKEQYAAQFFENIGDTLDAEQSIFYEDTGVFYSENGNDLWLDYTGMTWNFTDFATTYSEDMEENSELDVDESVDGTNSADDRNVNGAESVDDVDDTSTNAIKTVDDADEETIRNALKQYGVDVPEGCIFSKGEDGYYNFSADQIKQGNAMYDGTIECRYYDNGKLGEIWNRMTVSSYYKDFSVISEQDAYERIAKGKFYTWLEDADSYEIEVGKGTLNYEKDSKGFYQPTYLFSATVNGTKSEIAIPAIKK